MANIGLIGCGRVADLHMRVYKHIPEASVRAVSDVNLERANSFARDHGIKKSFSNYLDLIEMKDLDFVDICTPIFNHAEIALEVAKSGLNILVEKPMARNTSDCDKVINEVSKKRVKMCVCHNQLFLPQVMRAKNMVDSGELTLTHFGVSVNESAELIGAPSWIMTPQNGGVLWETGAHCAYLQLAFLKNIDEVYATGHKVRHRVYDHFISVIHTSDQSLGIIEVSWLAKKVEVVFDLMGSDGRRIQILDYDHFLELPERSPTSALVGFYWDQKMIIGKWKSMIMGNLRSHGLMVCLPHYNLITEYIQSIKNDSRPPVTPEDGRKTVELLERIEESLNTNQPVKMRI